MPFFSFDKFQLQICTEKQLITIRSPHQIFQAHISVHHLDCCFSIVIQHDRSVSTANDGSSPISCIFVPIFTADYSIAVSKVFGLNLPSEYVFLFTKIYLPSFLNFSCQQKLATSFDIRSVCMNYVYITIYTHGCIGEGFWTNIRKAHIINYIVIRSEFVLITKRTFDSKTIATNTFRARGWKKRSFTKMVKKWNSTQWNDTDPLILIYWPFAQWISGILCIFSHSFLE